ncbi:MAG TPA: 16S rRNA (uracil(1498)-N(3))-methyltransferase [Burkholderiales bacterium]|nr:16S rRNA (uracil(1498)-N(3))-methyltransferase [Burkholderiales bacterium]
MPDKPARLPRFFVDVAVRAHGELALGREAAHHAARVLRLRAGDALIVFDGRGGEYAAHVAALTRERVVVGIGAWHDTERESPLAVTLLQGISSGERMDFTVRKAVELGAAAIQPLLSARSVVRLSDAREAAKLEHWRRIVIAACEQCGRNRVPELRAPLAVEDYCRQPEPAALRLLLAPGAGVTLHGLGGRISGPVALAAGPEAGFSAREEADLGAAGFVPVSLGPRVLRTETAALAALAGLNALAGDG